MITFDVQKQEQKLKFLETELYVKREELNAAFVEAGAADVMHSFQFAMSEIQEKYPTTLLAVAHQIHTSADVNADLGLLGKLRAATADMNVLLEKASVLGVKLDLAQDIAYLDDMPKDAKEYTGRIAYILEIDAPNLDEYLTTNQEQEENVSK